MRAGIGPVGREHLQDLAYLVPILERHNNGLRDLVKQWEQMVSHINSEKFQTDPEEVINKFLEHRRIEGGFKTYIRNLTADTWKIADSWPQPLTQIIADHLQGLLPALGNATTLFAPDW